MKRAPIYLNSKSRLVLLENIVPNIDCSIHLGSEEDGWSSWTPARISEVMHAVFRRHNWCSNVFRPNLYFHNLLDQFNVLSTDVNVPALSNHRH